MQFNAVSFGILVALIAVVTVVGFAAARALAAQFVSLIVKAGALVFVLALSKTFAETRPEHYVADLEPTTTEPVPAVAGTARSDRT